MQRPLISCTQKVVVYETKAVCMFLNCLHVGIRNPLTPRRQVLHQPCHQNWT